MNAPFDRERDESPRPQSPLADRLQVLAWPRPTPEARARCLAALSARLGEHERPPAPPG